ncbi:DUF1206 domain-containing protein [Halomonas sp. V046]|uniref:DUF1206 domain-containing protein n=1 Tax=Halomonas sp. V046 TaxID=3459611 RepID=UPI004043DF38
MPSPLSSSRATAPWHQALAVVARAGYLAKGIVYLLIGVLAALGAAGLGGDNVGTREALSHLAEQPFGSVMLIVLIAGLFAYALWRFLQALVDVEGLGWGIKGLATRLAFLISGGVYASLGLYGIDLLRHVAGSAETTRDRTAALMAHPGGEAMVAALGAIFVGVGLRQMWRVAQRTYLKHWRRGDMSDTQQDLASWLTRWGLGARGLVFVMIGSFLGLAAWQVDPDQAQGLGGALDVLAAQPFGPWLLAAVALGLANYGTYCLINARFRRVRPTS